MSIYSEWPFFSESPIEQDLLSSLRVLSDFLVLLLRFDLRVDRFNSEWRILGLIFDLLIGGFDVLGRSGLPAFLLSSVYTISFMSIRFAALIKSPFLWE